MGSHFDDNYHCLVKERQSQMGLIMTLTFSVTLVHGSDMLICLMQHNKSYLSLHKRMDSRSAFISFLWPIIDEMRTLVSWVNCRI